MRHSLLILLVCCSSVVARDPFRPVAGSVCEASVEPLTGWRLQGIIGREAHFHAWLIGPKKEIVIARIGKPFPVAPWQLTDMTRRSITLAVQNSCTAQQTTFYLKGRSYGLDSHSAAGHQLPAAGLRR
ncbi:MULTISPECIES: HofP DNA utilization family protein [unclassified Pantoea]|uniref:HofP DNA utilization family protein n=1 Tax=unclassified Pantoea TaxID=2630326 RepID=UPI0023DBD9DF|nr:MULTISPECIES: HofP DNA utilization family protein [unclassified Pantoea]MDF2044084.1 HofP DNA utilization family protein [Pantoea sp. Cr_R14]MDF2071731.1 HofP DNA utilization family protein [Pantoea sp. Cr_R13]MDF2081649.1 HofP DNA utilization family protein [Pantoea sp. Cr_R21]